MTLLRRNRWPARCRRWRGWRRCSTATAACSTSAPSASHAAGRRGLYRSTGGHAPGAFEHALLWVLSQSDGAHDLLAIAERARLFFEAIEAAAEALQQAGLLRDLAPDEPAPAFTIPGPRPERHPT